MADHLLQLTLSGCCWTGSKKRSGELLFLINGPTTPTHIYPELCVCYLHLQLPQFPLEVCRIFTRAHLLVKVQFGIQQLFLGLHRRQNSQSPHLNTSEWFRSLRTYISLCFGLAVVGFGGGHLRGRIRVHFILQLCDLLG